MTIWTLEAAQKNLSDSATQNINSLLNLDVPSVVVALDASGSTHIDKIKDKFAAIAASIKGVNVYTCTFNTEYTEVDPAKDKLKAYGGTDLSAVERFINEVVIPQQGSYPTNVVVITDGDAFFYEEKVAVENENRWLFLLEGHYTMRVPFGTAKILADVAA